MGWQGQRRGFLVGLLVGVVILAVYAVWIDIAHSQRAELPKETWQPIQTGLTWFQPPPGTVTVIEVEERDGELYWRIGVVAIARVSNTQAPAPEKSRPMWRPPPGQDQGNLILEAAKKKKKRPPDEFDRVDENGILQDSNKDGLLEFTTMLFLARQENGAEILYTYFRHICCGCGLEHEVAVRMYRGYGSYRVYQRWDVDDKATHWNRVKKFGARYNRSDPFGGEAEMRDPWKAEPPLYE